MSVTSRADGSIISHTDQPTTTTGKKRARGYQALMMHGADDFEETQEEMMESIRDGFGEHMGHISSRSSDAHPFVTASFLLKMALAMFGGLSTIVPFLVAMSSDQSTMQLSMFIVLLIFSMGVFGCFHSLRCQEIHLKLRLSGYDLNPRLSTELLLACGMFVTAVMVQLIESIVSARLDGIPLPWVVVLALLTDVNVAGAVLFVVRVDRTYIMNDL